jgi:epoxyqueuosine reductase
MLTRERIQSWVENEELKFLGLVDLDCGEAYRNYRAWMDQKKHAGLFYLEQNEDCRRDPSQLLPGASAAIVFALPYDLGDRQTGSPETPRIAQYARFRDYHRILRERGERIAEKISADFGGAVRVVVDTAPLLERALADKTLQGFIGKNTCYIHPTEGSFLLLAEILTTAALPTDQKIEVDPFEHRPEGGCGICDRCQVACPTGALAQDYSLDASLCLSYWTIEHRGTIPEKFWPWLAQYYFGCDLCQLACPYNKPSRRTLPSSIEERVYPSLFDVATMDQKAYEKYFGGTPLTRAKRNGLRRNALIAMTVTADTRLREALAAAVTDAEPPIGETILQIEKWLTAKPGGS